MNFLDPTPEETKEYFEARDKRMKESEEAHVKNNEELHKAGEAFENALKKVPPETAEAILTMMKMEIHQSVSRMEYDKFISHMIDEHGQINVSFAKEIKSLKKELASTKSEVTKLSEEFSLLYDEFVQFKSGISKILNLAEVLATEAIK